MEERRAGARAKGEGEGEEAEKPPVVPGDTVRIQDINRKKLREEMRRGPPWKPVGGREGRGVRRR